MSLGILVVVLLERALAFQRVDGLLAGLRDRGLVSDQGSAPLVPALVVHGVAGVGKTSVLVEAASRARSLGCVVSFFTTSPGEHDWPYSGLDRLLRSLQNGSGVQDVGAALTPQSAAALLLDVVGAAAGRAPLVVVVDDVQWLDDASARCLSYVLRRLPHDPVLFLLGHRDKSSDDAGSVGPSGVQGARAGFFGDLADLRLEVLSQSGSAALARGLGVSVEVARAVAEHCGGLPLAVTQVVAALTPGQRGGREALPRPLPASAPELALRDRLHALGDGPCVAAAVAAVCSGSAAAALTPVLAALGVEAYLADIERAGLLALGATGAVWVHPLARAAALSSVRAATLRKISGCAAEALLAAGGHPDTVTWLRLGGADGPSEGLAVSLEAVAGRAEHAQAYAAAADAWERAADVGSDAARQGLRLARAASKRIADGAAEAGLALGTRALAAGVVGIDRWQVLLDMGRAAEAGEDPAQTISLYGRAAEAAAEVGDKRRQVRALTLAIYPSLHLEDARAADALSVRIVEAHDPSDPYQAFLASVALGFAALHAFRPEDGQPALESAIRICELASLLEDHHELVELALLALLWSGHPLRLRTQVLAALDGCRRAGDLWGAGEVLRRLAWCDFFAGQQESAGRFGIEALELARDGGRPYQVSEALTTLACVEGIRGNRALAVGLAQEAGRLSVSTSSTWRRADASWAETFACLSAGDAPAAAQAAGVLVDLVLADRLAVCQSEYCDAAIALAMAGHTPQAREVRDALALRFGDPVGPEFAAGLALADAAVSAPDPTVSAALADLAHRLVRIDQRLWRGRLLLAAGSILRRVGQVPRAQEHLRLAAADFKQFGALAWVERVNDELPELDVKNRSARTEPLTGAELRVARAVADGLTNREVASTLFVSTKTVEFHLVRVYRKLGVRNRTELARLRLQETQSSSSWS